VRSPVRQSGAIGGGEECLVSVWQSSSTRLFDQNSLGRGERGSPERRGSAVVLARLARGEAEEMAGAGVEGLGLGRLLL
jgi:hypothetical protein